MSSSIIVLSDRIKELSHSTGSGNLILDGAAPGFVGFSGIYAYNDVFYYGVTDGVDFEIGSGQYILSGSNNALRRYPRKSTNNNGLVNFGAGVKEVYVTYPGYSSVFTASGLGSFRTPAMSGLAFWGSEQILSYDSVVNWDSTNHRLGFNTTTPRYAIDIVGDGTYSVVMASGFIVGTSGVLFSGTASYSGGRQLEPFMRNTLNTDTGIDDLIGLSGNVSQTLYLKKQQPGSVFIGPVSGCIPPSSCVPDYPTFRNLVAEDIPDLSDLYVTQYAPSILGAVALYKQSGEIYYDDYLYFDATNNRLGVNNQSPAANLDVNGDAIISGVLRVGANLLVSGNLDVRGNITYVNSNNLAVFDKQIELGSLSGNAQYNDAGIDDGGIVLKSTVSDKKWTWRDSTDAWTTDQKISASGLIFSNGTLSGVYEAGSGLVLFGSQFRTGGTGNFSQLIFDSNIIRIGAGSSTTACCGNSSFIGTYAGRSSSGVSSSNFIGNMAGDEVYYCDYTNALGYQAGKFTKLSSYSSMIGTSAGLNASGAEYSNIIGYQAALSASGLASSNSIGREASYEARNCDYINSIGYRSAFQASGCGYSNFLGYRAGYSSDNLTFCNAIGYSAAQEISSSTYSDIFGTFAGYQAISPTYTSMFGAYAGYQSSGLDYATLIGRSAGGSASGCDYATMIGAYAGYNSSGCPNVVLVGNYTGRQASGADYSTILGYYAGSYSNDLKYSNIIGYDAGSRSQHSTYSNMIGTYAGKYSIDTDYSVINGYNAGYISKSCSYSVMVGGNAGQEASGCQSASIFGNSAGFQASGCNFLTAIGYRAGYRATGCDSTSMLGHFAGFNASGASASSFIGYGAGLQSTNARHSVFVGYYAGYGSSGNSQLSIKVGNSFTDWVSANSGTNNIMSICDTVMGVSDTKQLRIGASGTLSEVREATLSVKSTSGNVPTLKLVRNSGQSVGQLISTSGTSDTNTVINSNGLLRLPVFATLAAATGDIGAASVTNSGVVVIAENKLLVSNGSAWVSVSLS